MQENIRSILEVQLLHSEPEMKAVMTNVTHILPHTDMYQLEVYTLLSFFVLQTALNNLNENNSQTFYDYSPDMPKSRNLHITKDRILYLEIYSPADTPCFNN